MDGTSKRVELIPAKRRALILEHLRANGAASIFELAEEIGGSPSTIRRDLEHLTQAGYLERTHGGALLMSDMRASHEGDYPLNAQLAKPQKHAIGLEAAKRLQPHESVIFDSSSTVFEAAKAAAELKLPLTVVTNSLEIAMLASAVPDWKVIVPGGTVKPGSTLLTGDPGEEFFRRIHADICLTGSHSVHGKILTDSTMEVASLKRAMIRSARKSILLIDGTKFRPPAFSPFAELTDMAEIITDDGISPENLAAMRSYEVKVTVVAAEQSA
jgi:DeoR family transcriptional regulator, aga operon transcriptional repressor